MMKVLVVHDRPDITAEIVSIVAKHVIDSTIDVAEDGTGARQRLGLTIYDLLIIDLTLPHIKGASQPDYHVADELLKELFNLEALNIPGDVIGLTRDIDALESVNTSLGPHLMVTIHEAEDGNWRKYLADKISYAARAAVTRQVSVNQHYLYDACLVTALDKEFAPFKEKFDLVPLRHFPGAFEFVFADKDGKSRRGVAQSIGKSGQARAASVTQSLVAYFRPRLALMSGFCGGVESKSKLGDLMVFDASYDWDYGKWAEEKSSDVPPTVKSIFLSRPTPISIDGTLAHRAARTFLETGFNLDAELLKKVKQKSLGALNEFGMYPTPAASGSAVVANEKIVEQLRGLNESIKAVDMESYGFYFACSQTHVIRPQYLCLKAVSDFCNGEKGDDLHEACSEISASAAVELLTKIWEFE